MDMIFEKSEYIELIWNYDEYASRYYDSNVQKEFCQILKEKLEADEELLQDEIDDILRDDYKDTVKKRFFLF